MADLTFQPEDLEKLKSLLELSHLEVVVRADWGSQSPDHRERIHGELKKRMARAYPFSDSSISHCPSLGGFAFAKFDSDHVLQIGFDLEMDSRVTPEVVRRVCKTEEEFRSAPSPSSLWTAKEAAFKSLKGSKQPILISGIEITDWKTIDSRFETACLKNSHLYSFSRIQGVSVKKQAFTFTFFVAKA